LKKNQIVKIYGGLGNQLFQYAFAMYLSKISNNKILLDINEFRYIKHHSGCLLSELLFVKFSYINIFNHLKFKVSKFLNSYGNIYLKQNDYSANKIPLNDKIQMVKYFEGYWQNLTMVNTVLEDLISAKKTNNFNSHDIKDNFIAIHVRRGDYLNNEKMYSNICNKKYYENAVKYFEINFKNPKFFIFSDDINWCKLNLTFIKNCEFVDYNTSAIEDFTMMTEFKNKIISNSTFSWWAAMLNSKNKNIISPRVWNNFIEYNDLIPETWIKI